MLCPITLDLMEDPVVTSDGHTYDRSAIESWLKRSITSPSTNINLKSKMIYPNLYAQNEIRLFKSKLCSFEEFKKAVEDGDLVGLCCMQYLDNYINKPLSGKTTALHIACRCNYIDVVKMILSEGADLEAKDESNYTPLLICIKFDRLEILRILLSRKPNLYYRIMSALHFAAALDKKDAVRILITFGADVNKPTNLNNTPLHTAAKNRSSKVAVILIKNGADYTIKNNENQTAVERARSLGHDDFVERIIPYLKNECCNHLKTRLDDQRYSDAKCN
ncbi:hypothetical protein AKO1_005234 [Acrasis kona]|uniref:U-box domain-containing protein n=1 Tax=Acrasis kona TaxID=1008807 RepID=A0AAW2YLC1_9EUKA